MVKKQNIRYNTLCTGFFDKTTINALKMDNTASI